MIVGATHAQLVAFEVALWLIGTLGGVVLAAHFGGRAWSRVRARSAERVLQQLPEDVGFRADTLTRPAIELSGADPAIALLRRSGPGEDRGDLVVGAPDFDARVLARGDPLRLRALLDADTRAAVLACLDDPWGEVDWGVVVVGLASPAPAHVAARIAAGRRAVERLAVVPPAEVPARLAAIALDDPVATVREHAFSALAAVATDAMLAEVAGHLLLDPDPRVRAHAAVAAGPAGAEKLAQLAVHEDEAVRSIVLLGIAGRPGAVDALSAHLARHGDARAVAEALGRTGDPAAEIPLLALLAAPAARNDAARALGDVGSAAAVEALRALRGAVFVEAVARIQARLHGGGAEGGRVSLAAGAGGELSLAVDAGRIALADTGEAPREGAGATPSRPRPR